MNAPLGGNFRLGAFPFFFINFPVPGIQIVGKGLQIKEERGGKAVPYHLLSTFPNYLNSWKRPV